MNPFGNGQFQMYVMGVNYTIWYVWKLIFMQHKCICAGRNSHTSMIAPLPICSEKLIIVGLSQYYGGGPHCNTEYCYFCFLVFFFLPKDLRSKHHRSWQNNWRLIYAPLRFLFYVVTQVFNFYVRVEEGRDIIFTFTALFSYF